MAKCKLFGAGSVELGAQVVAVRGRVCIAFGDGRRSKRGQIHQRSVGLNLQSILSPSTFPFWMGNC